MKRILVVGLTTPDIEQICDIAQSHYPDSFEINEVPTYSRAIKAVDGGDYSLVVTADVLPTKDGTGKPSRKIGRRLIKHLENETDVPYIVHNADEFIHLNRSYSRSAKPPEGQELSTTYNFFETALLQHLSRVNEQY